MKKFGGINKLRQKCRLRQCLNYVSELYYRNQFLILYLIFLFLIDSSFFFKYMFLSYFEASNLFSGDFNNNTIRTRQNQKVF